MRAMSKQDKEKAGEWLVRAVLIAIATSVWFKVDKIEAMAEIQKLHSIRLDRVEEKLYDQNGWRQLLEVERKHSQLIFNYTNKNLSESSEQLGKADSILESN